MTWRRGVGCLVAAAALGVAVAPASAAEVTAQHDNLRTGWYPDEGSLAPAKLKEAGIFKLAFKAELTGQIYAQPLVANGTLLVVTENDWAYGLDPVTGEKRWGKQFGTAVESGAGKTITCPDLEPRVGITGTPVIDTETNVAYFVANQYVSGSAGHIAWMMHAINLSSGEELPHFPVEIKGDARNLAGVEFEPSQELER